MFGWKVRTRRQWDKYCLWVALIGGNLAGIVYVLPALSVALGAPAWPSAWSHLMKRSYSLLLMYSIATLAQAPRRRLLWIFAPPVLWLLWSLTDRLVTHNWLGLLHDLKVHSLGAVIYLLGGCVIGLVGGKFGRGLEEEDKAAEQTAQFDSTEGVWPPPPRRTK